MEYEEFKKTLKEKNLTPYEYEKALKEWCDKNKF